jgi:hypothetical protein
VLDRKFSVGAPNQVWVGDLTHIPTAEGWLFLAVVIDLFSRKVVGWSMRQDMQRELVLDALDMVWFGRNPGRQTGLIFHSDRDTHSESKFILQPIRSEPPLSSRTRDLQRASGDPTALFIATDFAGCSIGIGNGICVVLAHMHPHNLTRLGIHPEKSLVVYDLHRLGIGIDLPVIRQNVFNDERHRLGG